MIVAQLMASPFVGGPERQVLGLAQSLPEHYRSVFLSFSEGGRARPLLDEARRHGFEAIELQHNIGALRRAVAEVAAHLQRLRADVLCCSGYKPDLIGLLAARRVGVPVVSVSHGWTGATFKVRVNETLDRLVVRWMDRVVCVSEAQAVKVRRAGVASERVVVIRNAIGPDAFAAPDPSAREELHSFFPRPPQRLVGAAGRLSPEKGFGVLVEAATAVTRADRDVGFVLFGDGPLRETLARQIAQRGLAERFVLAGFRTDLGRFLPHCDLVALPSYTEGLPVIVLEAFAAGVPVVATAVGGTPEVIEEGQSGYLVPPGDAAALARRLSDLLGSDSERRAMGARGRQRVQEQFTFAAQARRYQELFETLAVRRRRLTCRQPA
ncbi:MAG TPA: glycosyltransferase [Gemmataceae bacterium]|nr:glycosyltransferase [Gemmataceae bacterium]